MDLLTVLHLLATAVLIGMSAAAIPPIVRALPPFAGWTQQGIKPWVCDLCMSFWSTLIASIVWVALGAPWPAGLAAFVVTFAITRHNSEPIGLPPGFPELQDSGAADDSNDRRSADIPKPVPGQFMLSEDECEMLSRVSEYHSTCTDENEMRSLSDGELGQLLDIIGRAGLALPVKDPFGKQSSEAQFLQGSL